MARHNTVCVDFDDCILPWGSNKPYEGVSESLHRLRKAGYRIVIFTSRLSPEWTNEPNVELDFIKVVLERHDIPWDKITSDKVPASVYFDDLAVRISKTYPLSLAINNFLATNSVGNSNE